MPSNSWRCRLPLEDSGRRCDYFTMVRDPIDRLVSAFYFCPDNKVIKDNRPKKVRNMLGRRPNKVHRVLGNTPENVQNVVNLGNGPQNVHYIGRLVSAFYLGPDNTVITNRLSKICRKHVGSYCRPNRVYSALTIVAHVMWCTLS